MRGPFRGQSGSHRASACLSDGTGWPRPHWAPSSWRVGSRVVCSGLHTQRLHPQLGVLRDVWPVPSAHWGLAGASPAPWPCPASVSMWTPGCTGGQGRPAANTGSWRWSLIRPQPCPGNRLQSPPSLPRGGPAHGSQTRDEPRLPGYVVPVAALQLGHRTTSRLLLAVLCLQESRLLWKAFCCGDGVGRAAWVGGGCGEWASGGLGWLPHTISGPALARQAPSAHGLLLCLQPVPACSPSSRQAPGACLAHAGGPGDHAHSDRDSVS